jgi:hypothetical protein
MWALRQLQRERIIVEFTEMADRGFWRAGEIFF